MSALRVGDLDTKGVKGQKDLLRMGSGGSEGCGSRNGDVRTLWRGRAMRRERQLMIEGCVLQQMFGFSGMSVFLLTCFICLYCPPEAQTGSGYSIQGRLWGQFVSFKKGVIVAHLYVDETDPRGRDILMK